VNPYFYSLGMLVTGRMVEQPYLSAMDVLAGAIANEEMDNEPPSMIAFLFRAGGRSDSR
jgi:hypothetical protein